VGVDIGGTKTLVAVFNEHGEIVEQTKFPTPKDYDHWLLELRNTAAHLEHHDFKAGGVAAPGYVDRKHGRLISQPNLPWKNIPLQADCEKTFSCPVVIENDANLAALSEAMLHPDIDSILYITISTGIGTGFVYKHRLEPSMLDSEGGHVLVQDGDKRISWEKYSAGRILYKHFGKKLEDIPASDKVAWDYIVRRMTIGIFANIAIFQPDLVIMGGSVGAQFDKYGEQLQAALDKLRMPVVDIPKVVEAKRPNECVIFGCYDIAKQTFGSKK